MRLWSVFTLHYQSMKESFDRLLGLGPMSIRINLLDELNIGFEELLRNAKDKILKYL